MKVLLTNEHTFSIQGDVLKVPHSKLSSLFTSLSSQPSKKTPIKEMVTFLESVPSYVVRGAIQNTRTHANFDFSKNAKEQGKFCDIGI